MKNLGRFVSTKQADSYKPVSNFGQGSDHFQMFLVARKTFGIYEQNPEKNQFPRLHLSQNIKSHVVGFLTKIDFKSFISIVSSQLRFLNYKAQVYSIYRDLSPHRPYQELTQ